MKIIPQRAKDYYLSRLIEKSKTICISFTGGLGAQILSTAIYHHFSNRSYKTIADLDYFSNPYRIATPGQKGQLSYWKWEMDCYGISQDSLATKSSDNRKTPTLHDGTLKFSMALEALSSPGVRALFDTTSTDARSKSYRLTQLNGERYLCLHVRRGDYLNVASHLVSSNALDNIASKFGELVDRILILSDTRIDASEFENVNSKFRDRIHIIDGDPDPVLAHSLMRNATVLICSNSQFSLSAGLLSNGLIIIPKVWFGANARRINLALERVSDFTIVR